MSVDNSPTRSEFQQRLDTARNMLIGGLIATAIALVFGLMGRFTHGEPDFISYVVLVVGAAGGIRALRVVVDARG